jgi:alkylation response protein AidB-like acyl-CoA dehydrogenase
MSNPTGLGKAFLAFNNFLDTGVAQKIGLRKMVEKITYQGTYNGIAIAKSASRLFKGSGAQSKAERPSTQNKNDLFDLRLTEEQEMVQQTIRQYATQYIRPVAEQSSEASKLQESTVQEFRALGLPYYSVPEALGGVLAEKSTVTQMIIAEELAYGDLGIALGLLAPISTLNAIVTWGTAAQQDKYVPAFLDEEKPVIATIAINEPTALFDPFQLKTKAQKTAEGYVLNGLKATVPMAAQSELMLIAADVENEGPAIFVVETATEGLTVKSDRSMGLRAAEPGLVELKNVKVAADARLGEDLNYQKFIDHVRIGWSALASGTARAVLDYVIPYANEREAFGEPISHRQAVAFMIANIKIEADGMQILTQRAASRAEQGLDFSREAYLAQICCADRGMEISNDGVQILGGYGFMRDYPVERWYRDLRAVAVCYNGMHL